MADVDLAVDARAGQEVYGPTGALLGTVADVDAGVLYVNPDPDPTEEAWAHVGEGEFVNYDNDWLGIPDYKVWSEADARADAGENARSGTGADTDTSDADAVDADFEEWPYTVTADEIDRVDDEGIHLKGPR